MRSENREAHAGITKNIDDVKQNIRDVKQDVPDAHLAHAEPRPAAGRLRPTTGNSPPCPAFRCDRATVRHGGIPREMQRPPKEPRRRSGFDVPGTLHARVY